MYTLAQFRTRIRYLKGKGLRYKDLQAQYGDVNPYYYSRLIREDGYRPPDWVLMAWGIEMPQVEVLVVDGVIPNRTLVIAGSIKRCGCGQWYLSNAPARKKCPLCSPYKGSKK